MIFGTFITIYDSLDIGQLSRNHGDVGRISEKSNMPADCYSPNVKRLYFKSQARKKGK